MRSQSIELFLLQLNILQLVTICATQLSSTSDSASCPNNPVVFTCPYNTSVLQWIAVPPPGHSVLGQVTVTLFRSSPVGIQLPVGVEGFMFQHAVIDTSNSSFTSTLTTITEVSLLNGSVVTCSSGGTMESRTITVADSPTSPSTLMVSSTQNQLSSSIITLDWDPPSSTGGVSVSYVLTISPTPLSGSPVTMETTSAQITISYNTPYNVTISAKNCAGSSSDVMVTIPTVVTCPSNPTPANRVTIVAPPPLPALVGSTLSFACNGETVSAICESYGRWLPDPTTYACLSVTCDSPATPSNGRVDVNGGIPPFSLGSMVNYRCDEGLFPAGDMTSTCESVGGVGTWRPNTNIICRDMPVNCTVPADPSNGTIVNYERLNDTVLEGTVLTYQCDNGLSLTGPNNISCTNAGVWSSEPEAIMCVLITEGPIAAPLSTGATVAISVFISSFLSVIIGFLTGVLVMYLCSHKKAVYSPSADGQANVGPTAQAGPVYEEVSPKEKIELNTNQAYGPVGL